MPLNPKVVSAPKDSLKLMFQNKSLLLLAFLPGVITIAITSIAMISIWDIWIAELEWWFTAKFFVAALTTLILWLAVGNLALVPFEDAIINRVQEYTWGEVRILAPKFHISRILKEIGYSLAVSVFFLILVVLSAIPGIALLSYIVAAWVTAWSFLATFYARSTFGASAKDKILLFFKNPIQNAALGAFINFILFVPIVNVWLLGYALILATLVHIRRTEEKPSTQPA